MTYSDQSVIAAVTERFIPVKLDLFENRAEARELNVYWTPTILFGDRRGKIHYESLDFLEPAAFLDLLDVGEAMVRLRWGEYAVARNLLGRVGDQEQAGPFTAEAIYRRGLVNYLASRDSTVLLEGAHELETRFPDSIWTRRSLYRLQHADSTE